MTLEASAASPAAVENEEKIEAGAPAAAEVDASSDANPTDSSAVDGKDANEPANLLDVVKSAVQPVAEEGAESSAAKLEGEEDKTEGEPEKGASEEVSDADLPFHNHPRFKQLVEERNELRPDAEAYRNITGFMRTHGLSAEEVAEGYQIMALLKSGDMAKLNEARDWFAARLSYLDENLGHALPEDLRERVNNGEVDEDVAQELAKTRAAAKLHEVNEARRQAETSEQEVTTQRQRSAEAMMLAVEDWETKIKASDPDYAKKAKLVETTCRAIVQETGKVPTNPDEAVALSEAALARVNEMFKPLMPQRRPINPTPRSSSTPAAAEPKTLREAIKAAVSG